MLMYWTLSCRHISEMKIRFVNYQGVNPEIVLTNITRCSFPIIDVSANECFHTCWVV